MITEARRGRAKGFLRAAMAGIGGAAAGLQAVQDALAAAGSPSKDRIAALEAERKRLQKAKKQLQAEEKKETKKRQRLLGKMRGADSASLLEVLAERIQAEQQGNATGKGKGKGKRAAGGAHGDGGGSGCDGGGGRGDDGAGGGVGGGGSRSSCSGGNGGGGGPCANQRDCSAEVSVGGLGCGDDPDHANADIGVVIEPRADEMHG